MVRIGKLYLMRLNGATKFSRCFGDVIADTTNEGDDAVTGGVVRFFIRCGEGSPCAKCLIGVLIGGSESESELESELDQKHSMHKVSKEYSGSIPLSQDLWSPSAPRSVSIDLEELICEPTERTHGLLAIISSSRQRGELHANLCLLENFSIISSKNFIELARGSGNCLKNIPKISTLRPRDPVGDRFNSFCHITQNVLKISNGLGLPKRRYSIDYLEIKLGWYYLIDITKDR
uniref:Uncharacterized protein n=1 Tax=Glossina pallidipes TaxID=7398 RepID=A0A1A9ZYV9_GLOPL